MFDLERVSSSSGISFENNDPVAHRYEGVPDGAIYLGRPWREFAKTVLLHCELGAHIRPEGWHDWNKPCFPATGYYAEFASTGAGSQGQRAAYVHQLTAEEAEKYTFERFWGSISAEG